MTTSLAIALVGLEVARMDDFDYFAHSDIASDFEIESDDKSINITYYANGDGTIRSVRLQYFIGLSPTWGFPYFKESEFIVKFGELMNLRYREMSEELEREQAEEEEYRNSPFQTTFNYYREIYA